MEESHLENKVSTLAVQPQDTNKTPDGKEDHTEIKHNVVQLSDLISIYGEDQTNNWLAEYDSVRKSDVDTFLTKKSIMMEKKGICRTYLAIGPDDKIIGFFTVGIKSFQITDNYGISKNKLRKFNISRDNVAQAYLLGQLSRSRGHKGLGKELIDDAMEKFMEAHRTVGCRTIRLDCKDDLLGYYKDQGFDYICKNKDNDLNQMVKFIGERLL